MRRAIAAAFVTLALVPVAGSALASELFSVGYDQSRRVVLNGTATNVVVSNPAVADVAMVDSHSIVVLGRNYGAADIKVFDRAGRMLFDGHVRVTPPSEGLVMLHRGVETTDMYCIETDCRPLVPTTLPISAFPAANSGSAPAATPDPGAGPAPTTNGATSPPPGDH